MRFVILILAAAATAAAEPKGASDVLAERDVSQTILTLRPADPEPLRNPERAPIPKQQLDEYVRALNDRSRWVNDFTEYDLSRIPGRAEIIKKSCDLEIKHSGCRQPLGRGLYNCLMQTPNKLHSMNRDRCLVALDPTSDGTTLRLDARGKDNFFESIKKMMVQSHEELGKWPECSEDFKKANCGKMPIEEKLNCLSRYFDANSTGNPDVACGNRINSAIVSRDNYEFAKSMQIMTPAEVAHVDLVRGKRLLAREKRLELIKQLDAVIAEREKVATTCAAELKNLTCNADERAMRCIFRNMKEKKEKSLTLGTKCDRIIKGVVASEVAAKELIQLIEELESFR